jgi:hypothetical protein
MCHEIQSQIVTLLDLMTGLFIAIVRYQVNILKFFRMVLESYLWLGLTGVLPGSDLKRRPEPEDASDESVMISIPTQPRHFAPPTGNSP